MRAKQKGQAMKKGLSSDNCSLLKSCKRSKYCLFYLVLPVMLFFTVSFRMQHFNPQ
jgi:hypothetical protein